MNLDHALLEAGLDLEDLPAESERLCRERWQNPASLGVGRGD
jgi:hypothetical protein